MLTKRPRNNTIGFASANINWTGQENKYGRWRWERWVRRPKNVEMNPLSTTKICNGDVFRVTELGRCFGFGKSWTIITWPDKEIRVHFGTVLGTDEMLLYFGLAVPA